MSRIASAPQASHQPFWNLSALTLLALVLFVGTRVYILFVLVPQYSDVKRLYWGYAVGVVDLHRVPYQDELRIEYPPLAVWTICLPRMLDNRPIPDHPDADQIRQLNEWYHDTFRREMFLCDLGSFLLLLLVIRERRRGWLGWVAIAYVVATAMLGHLLYDRLDIGLLLLIMIWAFCWTRTMAPSSERAFWIVAAYLVLGLAISYKLIPVIGLPYLLLAECRSTHRRLMLPMSVLALMVGACGPFLMQQTVSGLSIYRLIWYHSSRGIQIESLYSTLMLIGSGFGWPTFVSHFHGAYELSGSLAPMMKDIAIGLQLIFLSAVGLWAVLLGGRYSRRAAYCTTCLVLAADIILSNVLSPQYFVWSIPLTLLLAVEVLPNSSWRRWLLLGLIGVVVITTTWVFPYHYVNSEAIANGLVPPIRDASHSVTPVVGAILALRNFTYLGMMIWLGIMMVRNSGQILPDRSLP